MEAWRHLYSPLTYTNCTILSRTSIRTDVQYQPSFMPTDHHMRVATRSHLLSSQIRRGH